MLVILCLMARNIHMEISRRRMNYNVEAVDINSKVISL